MGAIRQIETVLYGVRFSNPDGTSRQRLIRQCRIGDRLQLVPEPENEHDRNAIAVRRQNGKQIGYLSREIAAKLSEQLQRNSLSAAFIVGFHTDEADTSEGESYLVRCVDLLLFVADFGIRAAQFEKYISQSVGNLAFSIHKDQFEQIGSSNRKRMGCLSRLLLVLAISGCLVFIWFTFFNGKQPDMKPVHDRGLRLRDDRDANSMHSPAGIANEAESAHAGKQETAQEVPDELIAESERKADEALVAKREREAAAKLSAARLLLKAERPIPAKRRLKEILEKYPGTNAATEAKAELDHLK